MPDAKQKTSKLADMLASASIFKSRDGIAVVVVNPFMALLSFRGIDTPSLLAQGEQRRPSLFNIRRDNPRAFRGRKSGRSSDGAGPHCCAGAPAADCFATGCLGCQECNGPRIVAAGNAHQRVDAA